RSRGAGLPLADRADAGRRRLLPGAGARIDVPRASLPPLSDGLPADVPVGAAGSRRARVDPGRRGAGGRGEVLRAGAGRARFRRPRRHRDGGVGRAGVTRIFKHGTHGGMTMADEKLNPILDAVDPEKRDFLKAVIVGTAFVTPIVASFSME